MEILLIAAIVAVIGKPRSASAPAGMSPQKKSNGQVIGELFGDTISGAGAGAVAGPYGAAAGAVVGLGVGVATNWDTIGPVVQQDANAIGAASSRAWASATNAIDNARQNGVKNGPLFV